METILNKRTTELKGYLLKELPRVCDAEPETMAAYVIALLQKDDSIDKIRESCVEKLEEFLEDKTERFVDDLFKFINSSKNAAPSTSSTERDREPERFTVVSKVERDRDSTPSHKQPAVTSQPVRSRNYRSDRDADGSTASKRKRSDDLEERERDRRAPRNRERISEASRRDSHSSRESSKNEHREAQRDAQRDSHGSHREGQSRDTHSRESSSVDKNHPQSASGSSQKEPHRDGTHSAVKEGRDTTRQVDPIRRETVRDERRDRMRGRERPDIPGHQSEVTSRNDRSARIITRPAPQWTTQSISAPAHQNQVGFSWN